MNFPCPLPIGIVGLNFGRHILDQLAKAPANRYFRIAAVCDMDAAKAADFARRCSAKAYASLDALLADPDIPVVGLYTGPVGRAELLRKIVRAGKDVMTTKPFELDPSAARSVLDEAAALGRVIHLNSPGPRPSPAVVKIREWVDTHALGRPVFCRGETTADYREQADGSWYDDPARCPVPPIFRLGIYLINDLIRLFGDVSDVQVLSSRLRTGRPTADNAQLGLRFTNGAIGSVYASFCVGAGQHYADSLLLHYERGSIQLNLDPAPFGQAGKSARLRLITTAPGEERVVTEEWSAPGGGGDYQWDALHAAIHARDIAGMPADTIVSGIEVIEAMIRADLSGRTETVLSPAHAR